MELLVRLRASDRSRGLAQQSNGQRRRSSDELIALARENSRHVEICLGRMKESLPDDVALRPAANLNYVLVSCPSKYEIDLIKQRIRQSCQDVESIVEDFQLEGV